MNLLYANDTPGQYPTSWYAATATKHTAYPPLQGDTKADVCVVGGGYTGLSAALHMAEAGYDVVLWTRSAWALARRAATAGR